MDELAIMERESAHSRLKRETSVLHRELDTLPQMRRLMSPELTEQSYTETLTVLFNWTQEASAKLRGLQLPHYAQPQLKLRALQQDLQMLHQPTTQLPQVVSETDAEFALGILYVIEGASMGARILAPRIEATLKRSDITRYYRLYGEQTLAHWQSTTNWLNRELGDEASYQRARNGADWAFNLLIEHFRCMQQEQTTRRPHALS